MRSSDSPQPKKTDKARATKKGVAYSHSSEAILAGESRTIYHDYRHKTRSDYLVGTLAEEAVVEAKDPQMPPKAKARNFFKSHSSSSAAIIPSFHNVGICRKKVEKVKRDEIYSSHYFFKPNDKGSLMSELEAAACGFYRLIIPHLVPSTRAIYDEQDHKFVGVLSKGIPGFKASVSDPLTEEDLDNPEAVKGLAEGLVASLLFEEDDLHRGNMSKYGQRIDFDMSLWSFLSEYKKSLFFFDKWIRLPKANSFQITPRDIVSFPNLQDAKPYYWPTKQTSGSTLKPLSSKNGYKLDDVRVYQRLITNPLFIRHKYKTFLKYALMTKEMFAARASLHIRADRKHNGKSIINLLAEHQQNRIEKVKSALLATEEFYEFIKEEFNPKNGTFKVVAEILNEFKMQNNRYKAKIDKKPHNKNQLIRLKTILVNFKQLFTEMKSLEAQRAAHKSMTHRR